MSSERNAKSERSEFEKTLLKLMIDLEVDQTDIANYEGVSPQAINNRLKRLNKKKMEEFRELIYKVANNKNGEI
jgi:predicted transcriptional regulator